MTIYGKHFTQTPQSEPLPDRVMTPNSAGGFSFAVDDWVRLDRWLILGSADGSYYATERKLTLENADVVRRCLALDAARTVARIVEISDSGRAPKNDPAILALAICSSAPEVETRQRALAALPSVCRTGTHLFHFVTYAIGR